MTGREKQVLMLDSESEESQDALSEVLAEHITDERKHTLGKMGNDYFKDPL